MNQVEDIGDVVYPLGDTEEVIVESSEEQDNNDVMVQSISMPNAQQQTDDNTESDPVESAGSDNTEDASVSVEESGGTSMEDSTVTTAEVVASLKTIEEYSQATCRFTICIFFTLLLVFGCFIMRFVYRIVTDTIRNM
ncbi:MAG: hypothetical protein Q4F24_11470 [Eubacteriales bacterium]|nr:hypothetical protein [Eubacteriales bacterium]